MSRSAPPNAYPKGCIAVGVGAYRRQPRGTVGAARAAERPLTEWVNVIAFSDRTRHLSSQFDKSQMIAVMGKSRWSRTRPGRASPRGCPTIVAEELISDAGTLQPNVPHPADIDDELKTAMDEATAGVLPERQPLPEDGVPELD